MKGVNDMTAISGTSLRTVTSIYPELANLSNLHILHILVT